METSDYAVLSSCGKYTSFTFKNHSIRFRTSAALKKYTEVIICGYAFSKCENGFYKK